VVIILETSVGLLVIALGIAVKKVIDTNKKLKEYSPFNSVIDKDAYIKEQKVERETNKLHGEFKLTKFAEAREYRETLSIIKEENKGVA